MHYGIVRYGTDPNDLSQTAKSAIWLNPDYSSIVFRVRLDNLKPRTTYYYTVDSVVGNGTSDCLVSPTNTFTTPARSVVGELEAHREKGYCPALPIAWTYLGLGETDAALEWLETALAERDPFLGSAMVFPGYDAIRDHPRFMRLTRELKLST